MLPIIAIPKQISYCMKIQKHTPLFKPKFKEIRFIKTFKYFFREATNRSIITIKWIILNLSEPVKHI